jgi:hypothetical protein
MVFPIVAPPDPWGTWCEQTWIYIISKSFHINMSSSSTVVLEKKILNDPTPFLHFWDYLPFEEDLTLDLYNFTFPLHKHDSYQVWLKLACWFCRRFLKIYSFVIISLWGRGLSFICTILNSLCLRMICAKFG